MRSGVWIRVAATGLGLTLVLITGVVTVGAETEHVAICHATGSSVHPFVFIEPSINGVVRGHMKHPDDIIPPVDWHGQHLDGVNWPSGGPILNNPDGRCVVPSGPEPPEVGGEPPVTSPPPFTG